MLHTFEQKCSIYTLIWKNKLTSQLLMIRVSNQSLAQTVTHIMMYTYIYTYVLFMFKEMPIL